MSHPLYGHIFIALDGDYRGFFGETEPLVALLIHDMNRFSLRLTRNSMARLKTRPLVFLLGIRLELLTILYRTSFVVLEGKYV